MAPMLDAQCSSSRIEKHSFSTAAGQRCLRHVGPNSNTHIFAVGPRCSRSRPSLIVSASAPVAAADVKIEDKWVAGALQSSGTSDHVPSINPLRTASLNSLSTLRMPTTHVEEYRFTDVSSILQNATIQPAAPEAATVAAAVARHTLKAPAAATIVVVDGVIQPQLSKITSLPEGVYVGGLEGAPSDIVSFALGAQTRGRGGPFAMFNGAIARDVVVVHVPSSKSVLGPVHVLYLSSSASQGMACSAPRLLAVLEEGSAAEIIEEFAPLVEGQGSYLTVPVTEIELDDLSLLKHSYVDLEAVGAAHMKTTLVNQGKESSYTLTEARQGGTLTRHDLGIEQLGEATTSTMKSFLLCGEGQTHDLHSKLKLDHPNGEANQLHKCIVSHASGRGVFDGNVKVNRLAQKTDAQQLSRNLLMVPKATVNVKPNLQIIADDVKCTHGCAISDLEEEELFYLRARGIDANTARQMLVYSFGREIVTHLRDQFLVDRVEKAVSGALKDAPITWTAEDEA